MTSKFLSKEKIKGLFPSYFEWITEEKEVAGNMMELFLATAQPLELSSKGQKAVSVIYLPKIGRITMQVSHSKDPFSNTLFVGIVETEAELKTLFKQLNLKSTIQTTE